MVSTAVEGIFARAAQYAREWYQRTGHRPQHFFVTSAEYDQLRIARDDYYIQRPDAAMLLMGMRVCCQERRSWYPGRPTMRHAVIQQLIQPSSGIMDDAWDPMGICETPHPGAHQQETVCPCGAVLWDLSPDGPNLTARLEALERHLDPLPPLNDLDEGLQCCGQHFSTFKAYMTHRRTVRHHQMDRP